VAELGLNMSTTTLVARTHTHTHAHVHTHTRACAHTHTHTHTHTSTTNRPFAALWHKNRMLSQLLEAFWVSRSLHFQHLQSAAVRGARSAAVWCSIRGRSTCSGRAGAFVTWNNSDYDVHCGRKTGGTDSTSWQHEAHAAREGPAASMAFFHFYFKV